MSEIFIDGYSEYELEALRIPTNLRTKCLRQLVDYTKCTKKVGVLRSMLEDPCVDEKARFSRCHQPSVNYSNAAHLAVWRLNNPSAFEQERVSPTLETIFSPTILNFQR